jgi:N-acetyl sugar amidotransferase
MRMAIDRHGGTATPADETALEREVVAQEAEKHAKARWPAGFESAGAKPYRMCARTVMDSSDAEIRFDERGVCHWVEGFQREVLDARPSPDARRAALERQVQEIRTEGRGADHDCVLGLSGGVDSSHLVVLAVELGLRPLIVHFDNGWNSELAVQNIEQLVRRLGLTLSTFVMDWPEFRDLQRSYFKASVLDLEVPTDHMIFGAIYKVAAEHHIRHVISGNNVMTEWLLPRSWYYPKFDLVNLRNIHRAYGTMKLRKLPALGLPQSAWYHQVRRIRPVKLLDLIDYDKPKAKQRLIDEFGWRDYGGKHHESVFTRFYQGYILPRKFNIDKRKAHLSNLILAGQTTRVEALAELLKPPYEDAQSKEDFTFVAKKLGFTEQELHDLLELPNRSHLEFGSDARQRAAYQRMLTDLQAVKPILRPLSRLWRAVRR